MVYVETYAVPSQWGRHVKPKTSKNVEVSPEMCLRDVLGKKEYVVPGYPVVYLAVRDSRFAKQLEVDTVWKKE